MRRKSKIVDLRALADEPGYGVIGEAIDSVPDYGMVGEPVDLFLGRVDEVPPHLLERELPPWTPRQWALCGVSILVTFAVGVAVLLALGALGVVHFPRLPVEAVAF